MHPCPFQYLFQKVLRYLFRLVRFLSDTALSASLKNFLQFFHLFIHHFSGFLLLLSKPGFGKFLKFLLKDIQLFIF